MARETGKSETRAVAPKRTESEPYRDILSLRDTINGMFEDFFSGRPLMASLPFEQSYGERGWVPPVDICETDKELVAYVGLLGIKKEDCKIEVQDDTLVLSGECKEPAGDGREFLRHELPCGKFYRAFTLPSDVKADQVKASYHDGLLEIRMPKAQAAQARRIEIQ